MPHYSRAASVFVGGVGAQVGRHQPLKLIALVAGISRRAGEIVQDSVDRGHQVLSGGHGRPVGRACDGES